MRVLVVMLFVLACRGSDKAAPAQGSNAGSDPWAATPHADADDPPSLVEKHRLADEACPKVTAPYFYRVEKDGKVNYLLGTRHIGVPFAKFPKVVHDTVATSKRLVFELAPGDHHTPDAAQDKALEISVPDVLGPDLWKHYRELVGGRIADRHRRSSPLLAVLRVALVYDDASALLEHEIQDEAAPLKLPMEGLETADFQHDVLVKLFDDRLLRAIIASTKDRAELRDDKIKGLRSYCDGTKEEDVFDDRERKALHDVGYSDDDITGYENTLVYGRNASWIPKLKDLFAGGDVFVAVGAGHLRGPKGVPALLKEAGYKVTRVTPPPLKP